MKKLKAAALIILAAAFTATAMSGCGIIRAFLGTQPETVIQTIYVTEEPTTAEQTSAAPLTTEAPETTKAQPVTEAPKPKYSTESKGDAVLLDNEKYHDSYLGITFTMPAWVGKVYAQSSSSGGQYSLGFFEKTNYDWGETKGWSNMGMLFTVTVSDKETTEADIIYPAGSEIIGGKVVYLNYFKPTDVRFNTDDQTMTSTYRTAANHQKDYFTGGVVDADKFYVSSSTRNAMNLKAE